MKNLPVILIAAVVLVIALAACYFVWDNHEANSRADQQRATTLQNERVSMPPVEGPRADFDVVQVG